MKNNYKYNSRSLFKRKKNQQILFKLSNMFCKNGKKQIPLNVLLNLLRTLKVKKKKNGISVLMKALNNISPVAELKVKVMGRVTHKIPVPVSKERELKLGIKVLSNNVQKRLEPTFFSRLVGEILDSFDKRGNSYKFKLDLNKEIKQNRSLVRLISLV